MAFAEGEIVVATQEDYNDAYSVSDITLDEFKKAIDRYNALASPDKIFSEEIFARCIQSTKERRIYI